MKKQFGAPSRDHICNLGRTDVADAPGHNDAYRHVTTFPVGLFRAELGMT